MTQNYKTKQKSTRLRSWVWCCVLFVSFGLLSGLANAQPVAPFTGAYTVDPSIAASATNWTSMASAFTALNTSGITGAVTISCNKGQSETNTTAFAITLGSATLNASTSLSNTIKFQSSGSGANYKVNAGTGGTATATTTTQHNGVIALNGADYVTFDGIDIADANTGTAAMEYGYGMYKLSATDGCNNNTIKNCSISLYRLNNTNGTLPAPIGSTGILIVNATQAAPTVALTPTATSGSNSGNKIYTNTIQLCNVGVSILGFGYTTTTGVLYDNANDIGGSTAGTAGFGGTGTGNIIKDWGPGTASIDCYGIRLFGQYNVNVRYNTVNNDVLTTQSSLGNTYGIYNGAALSAPATISNNTVTLRDAGTTTLSCGITNLAGSTPTTNTVTMSNNTITGFVRTSNTTGATYGIWNQASCNTLTMNSNTISSNSLNNQGSAVGYLLYNSGAVATTINMNSNTITGSTITGGTTASSGAYYLIYNTGSVATTTTCNINSNTLTGSAYSGAVNATHVYGFIYSTVSYLSLNIQSNTITGSTLKTTNAIYGIYPSTFTSTVNASITNNTLNNITRTATISGSGALYGIYSYQGTSYTTAGTVSTTSGNTFSNVNNGLNTSTIYGIANGGAYTTNFFNNSVYNLTATSCTGTMYGLYVYAYYANVTNCYGNTVHDITLNSTTSNASGTFYGMYMYNYYATTNNYYNNSIYNITGANLTMGAFYHYAYCYGTALTNSGLVAQNQNGNRNNVYNNQVYNISNTSTGASAKVFGYQLATYISNINVYNNIIGDLKAPNTTSNTAIYGIWVNAANSTVGGNSHATATFNCVYNTIYLAATTASATTFGTSGIYISALGTPATGVFKNNIVVNNSANGPTGGYASAVGAAGAMTNLTGDYNLYYGGTPGASNLIYGEGGGSTATNGKQTVAAYVTYSGQESHSVTENPGFASVTSGTANYLNFASAAASQAEGGGIAVNFVGGSSTPAITTDYNGTTRGSTNSSTPDIGAYEFFGSNPAATITLVSATPSVAQCTTTSRAISANVTYPGSVTLSSVNLNYSINGVNQTPIAMSNGGSGSVYTGTLPASSPTNATIVWYVSAITTLSSTNFTANATGGTYQDEPLLGLTASATVTPTTVCAGSPASLVAYVGGTNADLISGSTSGASLVGCPLVTNYGSTHSQYIVKASELLALGVVPGNISSLAFYLNAAHSAYNAMNYKIMIGHTTNTAYAAFGYISTQSTAGSPALQTVFSGTWPIVTTVGVNVAQTTAIPAGWQTFPFSSAFVWDGVSNVVIDVSFLNCTTCNTTSSCTTGFSTGATYLYGTLGTNQTCYAYADGNCTINTLTPSGGTQGVSGIRPNMRFGANVLPAMYTNINWYDNTAPTTSLGTGNNLTINPTAATSTYFATLANSIGCSINTSATPTITTLPLPIAPTASSPSSQCGIGIPTVSVTTANSSGATGQFNWYTASTGGSLLQTAPNSGVLATRYSNNFTSSTLTGASLTGTAAINTTTGVLNVNTSPATTSAAGGFTVNAAGYNSTIYQTDFDLSLTSTGATIADGFSYSFGDDVSASTSTPSAEHGSGSKLRLGFFTYNAASGSDGKGVYLMYGVSATTGYTSATAGVLGYSTNVAWVPTTATTTTSHVTLSINALGQATVSVGGTTLFTNVQLPAGFLSANKSTWQHAFSARSGGIAGNFALDNVVLQQDPLTTGSTTYLSTIGSTTTFYVSELGTNGCYSTRTPATANVSYGDAVTAASTSSTNTPTLTVCLGGSHTLSWSQTGANSNLYVMTWSASPSVGSGLTASTSGGSSATTSTPILVTPTVAGTYTYTVSYTDAPNGGVCSGVSSITVVVNALPAQPGIVASVNPICAGTSSTMYAYSPGSTAVVGTGTTVFSSVANACPFTTNYGGAHSQYIVKASELTAAGLQPGPITGLQINLAAAFSAYTAYNYEIRMGHTSATAFAAAALITTQSTSGSPALQLCYSGKWPVGNTTALNTAQPTAIPAGMQTLPFSTASFSWDGVSNVVIDITHLNCSTCNTTTSCTTAFSSNASWTGHTASFNSSVVFYADGNCTVNTMAPSGTNSAFGNWRPNITFIGNAIPSGAIYNYTWNNSVSNFSTAANVTVTPSTTTSYTLTFTNPTTLCTNITAPYSLVVNPIPSAPTTTAGAHCGLATPTALATSTSGFSGSNFKWYTAATAGTLLQNTTSATYTTPTSATATYYVSEFSAAGCESATRTSVTETVTTPDAITAANNANTGSANNMCLNAGVNLSATKTGTYNIYTYSWSASPATGSGLTSASSASSSANLTVTPTAIGTYVYTCTAIDASLGCVTTSTTTVTVNPLPATFVANATPNPICGGALLNMSASAVSGSGSGTTMPTGYGASNATSSFYGEIINVEIGSGASTSNVFSNNTSICGSTGSLSAINGLPASTVYQYSNYTNLASPILSSGITYNYSVDLSHCVLSTTTVFSLGIWIDYNRDGAFNTTTEQILVSSSLTQGVGTAYGTVGRNLNGTFVVPATAGSGPTLMRVVNWYNGTATSTGTFTYGETEDYMVNLSPATYSWNIGSSSNVASGISATANVSTTAGVYNVNVVATNTFGCTSTSANTPVTVTALPATPTSTNSTQCGLALPNASVSNGSGVHTWSWYNVATNGTALQTSTSNKYTTPINATTTFYVAQVSPSTGCESVRKSVVATVTAPNPIAITNNNTNMNNCWATALSLTAAKSPNTGANVYNYVWTASPSTGSGITGTSVSGATLSVTPTLAGTYVYTVTATDATLGCVTQATYTVNQLSNLASATVTSQAPTTCGSTGSILVTPPISSASLTTLWASNFATSTLNATYEYICGTPTPAYNGNSLTLTANVGSQTGTYQVLNPNGIDADIWQTEFDLTTAGVQGADGFSYSFGDNVSTCPQTNAEVGSGDKLHISFDAYTNGSNVAGIYLTYGAITNTGGHYPPNTPSLGSNPDVLGYSNNVSWCGGTTSHLIVTINSGGQITVQLGSTILFNNIQLPAAFLAANKQTWTHVFAARTGGVAQGHELGNVSIKYIPRVYQYSSNYTAGTPTWQASSSFTGVAVPATYAMGIRSTLNNACVGNLGNVTVGVAPTLTVSASAVTGCPGATTVLTFAPALTGYTYQWEKSTTSATTGFTAMSGQTSAALTWGVPSTSTWYRVGVTCAGNTTYSGAINIVSSGLAATVPFLEDFESITTANTLPACMTYGSGNINLMIAGSDFYSPSYTTYSTTYTSQQNHTPGGNKWVSFYYYNANGVNYINDRYIYSQAITLVGGQTYQASVWYAADAAGASADWNLYLKYGPAQTYTGMTTIAKRDATTSPAGINGGTGTGTAQNILDRTLQQLKGTFTPTTSGDYVIGIEAKQTAQYTYYALTIDDLEVLSACSGTPSAPSIPSSVTACLNKSTTLNVGSVSSYGLTYIWEQSCNGTTYTAASGTNNAATYATPTTLPCSPTYYRCKVTCTASGLFSYSNSCGVSAVNCQFNIARNTGITYTDISSSPTVQNPTWSAATTNYGDDNLSETILLPAGFNFTYNGQPVTGVRMSVNGWLTLDPANNQPSATGTNTNYSFTTNSVPYSVVAPFWNDLAVPGYTGTNTISIMNALSYDVTGTAPNRVATFQWKGMEKYAVPGPDMNFQVKLYESSLQANHKIDIVYGPMMTHNGTANTYFYWYAGIKSASVSTTPVTGEFYCLQNLNTNRWDKVLPTYGFYDAPQCNTSYTFIPGTGYVLPAAPSTAAPSNDDPTGAIALALNGGPCTDLCYKYYNTQYATASGYTVYTGGTQSFADDDMWFSFTIPTTPTIGATGVGITINGTYGFVPKYEIWNSGLTTALGAQVGGTGLQAYGTYTYGAGAGQLTPGNTYYVRVYNNSAGYNSYGTSGYTGLFSICTYENFPPPANDDPCGAYALTASSGTACTMTNYTSVAATQSGNTTTPLVTVPATPTCGAVATFNNDDDVWFTYTAINPTATIYVQGNGSYDPVVELYTASGTCAAGLTLVASSSFGASCSNVTSTGGLETINLTGLVSTGTPTKLYVRVYHKLTAFGSGSFGICVLSNTPPANDACANATALTFGTACNTVTSSSAYGTLSQATSASCSTSNPDDDVWFTVTRPAASTTMNVVVTGSSNYNTAFEVFTGTCGSLTSLGCTNTSSATSNAVESKLYTGLLAATTTYRIRVYNAAAGFGSGTFSICVYSGVAPSNVVPCSAPNASANTGYIAGLPTVLSAYDNGGSVYAGLTNANVASNPPSGPSLVYYTGSTAYAYAYSGSPTPSCGSVATTPKPVWYKFRVPTFSAGLTVRSVTAYGQTMTPILAAYILTGNTICNTPIFTPITGGCSSSGTLTLSSTALAPYMVGGAQYGTMVDHYVYVQLQGSSSVPSGNYTISVQGTVTGHTLTNPTTTSLRVNFPSFSNPAPGKYVVYWQKVGSAGANYVNLTPASSYVINGLNSNQSYKVWVKYMDISSSTGSQIYAAAVTANTTAGCGGNLGAPSVVQTVGHCKQVDVSWISVTSQGVPTNLVPASSTYPYRVLYNYTNVTGFHGFVQALASQPVAGYHVANLPLSQLVNFSYTFKCVGGAVMSSYTQAFTTCAGPARAVAPTHTEYVIGDVHYVDASEEELMAALSANMVDDGEIHEFNLVNIANEGKSEVEAAIAAGTFELIPNPTSSNVTVNYSLPTANATSATVRVMDVQGKVVREEKLSNPSQNGSVKFELTELEAGVYLVNIQSEGYTETKKLVVSK